MTMVEILINEHRVIERVIDCLAKIVDEGMMHGKINFLRAEEAIDFFRNFADEWHHKKEEDHLFPIMTERNIKGEDNFDHVADLMSEHEKGRSHVRGMDGSFREAAHGSMDEVMTFARHAREYIDLLRGHILKEDRVVFPLAEKEMTEEDRSRLQQALDKIISEDKGTDTEKKYIDIAESLAMIYNVSNDKTSYFE